MSKKIVEQKEKTDKKKPAAKTKLTSISHKYNEKDELIKNQTNKPVKKVVSENPNVKSISSFENDLLREGEVGDDTEVYDEADIASALERGFIAQALERHKEKMKPESHPDFDGTHCIDCDVEIPKLRLDMGRIRCFDCQTLLEKKANRR